MTDFINHKKELADINKNIIKDTRVNIVYSFKGVGKSSLIRHAFETMNNIYYINVLGDELINKKYAEDFYYIKLIAESVCANLPISHVKKIGAKLNGGETHINFSLSVFFAGIGFDAPKKYTALQFAIIKAIKPIQNKIYIHIEDMQKIDMPSFKFLMKLVNQTTNVFLYLEYVIEPNSSILLDSFSSYLKFNIQPEYIKVNSLSWEHVCNIFKNLNLDVNKNVKKEYKQLNGNVKALIFSQKNQHNAELKLNQDEQFLLNLIALGTAELNCNEIYEIVNCYKNNYFKYALGKLQKIISIMIEKQIISEINGNLYITNIGLKILNPHYKLLAIEVLSEYYMPIIESNQKETLKDTMKGIKLLASIFAQNNDDRIEKIIPYIKQYLLPLNYNRKIIEHLFESIDDYSKNKELFFCLIQIYFSLGCYKSTLKLLENNYIECSKYNIYYSIALIHTHPEKSSTETKINDFIKNEKKDVNISSLYTCLVALYMKTKSSAFVIDFVQKIYKNNLVTLQDKKIINKSISIYFDYSDACKLLLDSIKYFKKNKMWKFAIASYITYATRYAQYGKLNNAKKILELLSNSLYLSEKDLVYIENNLANVNMYLGKINENIYDSYYNAYSFLDDEYTQMLAANNLLIYHTLTKDYKSAKIYADKIEDIGFCRYIFDEYLHLTYTNLLLYYEKVNNESRKQFYTKKLRQLKKVCKSKDLKSYIDKTLNNYPIKENDKWFFMSRFNYRVAFMGHWVVNSLDY